MKIDSNYHIKLIGYCSVGKETLLERFVQEGPSSLVNLKGEYVIVIENKNECYIITSPYGVCQYYYTVHKNELFHDDTVLGVLQKSRLLWSWNWKALADLTYLDHVLENDTLHPQIHRVPPGSILHFRNGMLKISFLTWEELHPSSPAYPDIALSAFNNATKEWIGDNVVLALSGGFDSRVILSSLLKHSCRPLILTMGFDNSTDVIISRQIATTLGLDLQTITLEPEDYLKYGNAIVTLTNGMQIAHHWHAYMHTKKAKVNRDYTFFAGTNGEFARSYYLDKGIIALAADMVAPLSLLYFWKRSLKSIFKKEELNSLSPEFSNEFTEDGRHARLRRIVDLCHKSFLSGLDRFYLGQRVRNFFGNVLKLYSENVSWITPFLDREWVSAIWNLERNWKLGSNWHRFAIGKNYRQLLDFPEPGKRDRMYSKAPLLYWHPLREKHPIVFYAKYPEWFQDDIITEFILQNTSLLSELIEKDTVISIVKQHKKEKNRTRTVAFLLTMLFWLMKLKRCT